MSKDLNVAILIGRLTKDVETKNVNGTTCGRFSIANNDSYVSKSGEKKENASFFDVIVWGKQAENCAKYIKKGSMVAIEGRLNQNRWTDNNNQSRSKIEIIANSIQFLDSKSAEQKNNIQPDYYNDPWGGQ